MMMSSGYGGMSTPSKPRPRPNPRAATPEVEVVKSKKTKRRAQSAVDTDTEAGAPPKKRQAKGKGKEKDTSATGAQGANAETKKAGPAPKAMAKQDKGKGKELKSKDDVSETLEAKHNQEMLMQRVLQQQMAQHKDTLLQQVMKQKREANRTGQTSSSRMASPAPCGQVQAPPSSPDVGDHTSLYGPGSGTGAGFASSPTPGANGTYPRPTSRSSTPNINSSPTPAPRIPKPLPREWATLATSSSHPQQQFYQVNSMNAQPQYQHQLPPKPPSRNTLPTSNQLPSKPPPVRTNLLTPQPKSKLTSSQQVAFYNECVKRGINPTQVPVERLMVAMERFRARVEEASVKGLRDVGQEEKEFLSPESMRILRGENRGEGIGMGLGIQGLEGDLRMRMGIGMGAQSPGASQGFMSQILPSPRMGQSQVQGQGMQVEGQNHGMQGQYNEMSPPPLMGSQGLEGYSMQESQMSPAPRTEGQNHFMQGIPNQISPSARMGSQGLEEYQLMPNQMSPSLHMRDQTPGLGQMSPPPMQSQSPGMGQIYLPGAAPFDVLLRSPSIQNRQMSSQNMGLGGQNYGSPHQMSPPGINMGVGGHGHGQVQQNRGQTSSLTDTMGMDFEGSSGIQYNGIQMSPPNMTMRGQGQGKGQHHHPQMFSSNADQGRMQAMANSPNIANMRSFQNQNSAPAQEPISKIAHPKQQIAQENSEVQGQMGQPNPGAPKIVLKMHSKPTTQVNLRETTNASQTQGNARKVQNSKRTAKPKPTTPLLPDDQQMKKMLLSQLAETPAEQAAASDAYLGSDDEHEKRRRALEKNVRAASGYKPRAKPGTAKAGGAKVESAQQIRRNPPRPNSRQRSIQPEEDLESLEEEEPPAVAIPKTRSMQQPVQSPVEQLINKFQPLGSPQLQQKGGLSPIDKLMITKFGPQNQRQAQLHQKNLAQTPFQKLVNSALEDRDGPIRHRGKGKIRGSKFNEKYNELVSDVPQPPPFSPITPVEKNDNQKQNQSTHGPPPQQKPQEKQPRPHEPLPLTQDEQHKPHSLYQAYQQRNPQAQPLAPPQPPAREPTLAERFPPPQTDALSLLEAQTIALARTEDRTQGSQLSDSNPNLQANTLALQTLTNFRSARLLAPPAKRVISRPHPPIDISQTGLAKLKAGVSVFAQHAETFIPGFEYQSLDEEQACSFCSFGCDFGVSDESTWLGLDQAQGFCAGCHNGTNAFVGGWQQTMVLKMNGMSGEEKKGLMRRGQELQGLGGRNTPLKDGEVMMGYVGAPGSRENPFVVGEGGSSGVEGVGEAVRSKIDGRDVTTFQGIMFCRGSPWRQLDITKARICTPCRAEKEAIINCRKHVAFESTLHTHLENLDGEWDTNGDTSMFGEEIRVVEFRKTQRSVSSFSLILPLSLPFPFPQTSDE